MVLSETKSTLVIKNFSTLLPINSLKFRSLSICFFGRLDFFFSGDIAKISGNMTQVSGDMTLGRLDGKPSYQCCLINASKVS